MTTRHPRPAALLCFQYNVKQPKNMHRTQNSVFVRGELRYNSDLRVCCMNLRQPGRDTERTTSEGCTMADRLSSKGIPANLGRFTRRGFLMRAAGFSAAAVSSPMWWPEQTSVLALADGQTKLPDLAVGVGKDASQLVDAVLKAVGGIGRFVKKGQTVVIKPNIGWDRAPEYAANTNPEVVAALAKQALDAGASKVSVFDRTCNNEQRCYANSGIGPALEKLGDKRIDMSFVDKRLWVDVPIEKGQSLKQWPLYKPALEADCYINVPVAKHHGLSRLTLGLKNTMGVIGGRRGKIHHEIAQNLADLATVIQPDLTVIDATRILLRHGPRGGNLADVEKPDTLIASTDPVAADAHATTLFDMQPNEIGSTRAAAAMGLGEMDLDKLEIAKVA